MGVEPKEAREAALAARVSKFDGKEPAKNESEDLSSGETVSRRKEVAFPFRMTTINRNRLKALADRDDRSMQYLLDKIVWPAVEELERG